MILDMYIDLVFTKRVQSHWILPECSATYYSFSCRIETVYDK